MVGFLIAAHEGFARGIFDNIELVAGRQGRIDMISTLHETSIDIFEKELTDKVVELGDSDGVIVFCDLLLVNPYNQATVSYRALQGKHEHRIMSGVSLPIILETLSGRAQDLGLDVVSCMAQNAGKEKTQEFFEEFAKVSNIDMIR